MNKCYPIGNVLSSEILPMRAFTFKVIEPNNYCMKLIPTPSEINESLRQAFLRLLAIEKEKGNGQKVIAEAIEVVPNYVSNLANDRKGFGEEIIAKLDAQYPDWRVLPKDENEGKEKDKSYRVKVIDPSADGYLNTIIFCYQGLKDGHKEFLAMAANNLYKIDNPKAVDIAIPFTNPATNKKEAQGKAFLGNVEEQPGEYGAANSKNSRVQK